MVESKGKYVAIIGERDGIPGPAIEECLKDTGAIIGFSTTACFVRTASGAMDMENRTGVLEMVVKHGKDNVVVVLGGA